VTGSDRMGWRVLDSRGNVGCLQIRHEKGTGPIRNFYLQHRAPFGRLHICQQTSSQTLLSEHRATQLCGPSLGENGMTIGLSF